MTGLADAQRRARRVYPASRQFQRAYLDGYVSARDGRPETSCPYRNPHGWTAWRRAWQKGYRSYGSDS